MEQSEFLCFLNEYDIKTLDKTWKEKLKGKIKYKVEYIKQKNYDKNSIKYVYGHDFVGEWYCKNCDFKILPEDLKEKESIKNIIWILLTVRGKLFKYPMCRKCCKYLKYKEEFRVD